MDVLNYGRDLRKASMLIQELSGGDLLVPSLVGLAVVLLLVVLLSSFRRERHSASLRRKPSKTKATGTVVVDGVRRSTRRVCVLGRVASWMYFGISAVMTHLIDFADVQGSQGACQ